MKIWKSHENEVEVHPSNSSRDRRSTLPLSSTVWIPAISAVELPAIAARMLHYVHSGGK